MTEAKWKRLAVTADRLTAAGIHWGRAWVLTSLVRLVILGRHFWTPLVLGALAMIVVSNLTITLARPQRTEWREAVRAAAMATFCTLGISGVIDLCWAGWWDVAFLICATTAPIIWATSLIIWNLDDAAKVLDERAVTG